MAISVYMRTTKLCNVRTRSNCFVFVDDNLNVNDQKEMINNVRVIEPLGKRDHSQIQFNLRVQTVNKGTKQKRRDFRKVDYDGMRQYAQHKKWKLLLKIRNQSNAGKF